VGGTKSAPACLPRQTDGGLAFFSFFESRCLCAGLAEVARQNACPEGFGAQRAGMSLWLRELYSARYTRLSQRLIRQE
jgi:hypothetical protein